MIPNKIQSDDLEIMRTKPVRFSKTGTPTTKKKESNPASSQLSKAISDSQEKFPLYDCQTIEDLKQVIQEKRQEIAEGKAKSSDLITLKRQIAADYFSSDGLIECLSKLYTDKAIMGKSKNPEGKVPQIHVIGGPPGSGKSTIINKILKQEKSNNNIDLICIDPDELVTYHPQFKQIKELFGDQWGEATTVINRPARQKIIDNLCDENYNICIEGCKTFANYAEQAIKKGYSANVHLPLVPPIISQQRSVKRIADQLNQGLAPRGIMKQEYSDLENGHHIAGLKTVIDLFKNDRLFPESSSDDNQPTHVTLHTTQPNGSRKDVEIKSIEDFFDVYGTLINKSIQKQESCDLGEMLVSGAEISASTNSAQNSESLNELVEDNTHFASLDEKDKRRHIDRVAGTLQLLCLAGADLKSPQIQPFLKTMGVTFDDNNFIKIYGKKMPLLIGKHDEVSRTEDDFKRVSAIIGVSSKDRSWQEYAERYGYTLPKSQTMPKV